MRLLLVAYPGAGKGTQATKLAAHYGIAQLSSGELLRAEVAQGTPIGERVDSYLRRGDLVPDDLVFELLSKRVLEAAQGRGYVLDGFPRTLRQAEATHSLAQAHGVELQAVIYPAVGRDELLRRLRARATQEGRDDDDEATIANRFNVFETQTEPLLDYYAQRGLVLRIDGEQPVEAVFADITRTLDSMHI
jgi:adenylate kinase